MYYTAPADWAISMWVKGSNENSVKKEHQPGVSAVVMNLELDIAGVSFQLLAGNMSAGILLRSVHSRHTAVVKAKIKIIKRDSMPH